MPSQSAAENEIERILQARNHHEVLDVQSDVTDDELRERYLQLARIVHPDKNSHSRSCEAFKLLEEAKRALDRSQAKFAALGAGLPSVPARVWLNASRSSVTVFWSPSESDGGDPITHYELSVDGDEGSLLEVPRGQYNETLQGLEVHAEHRIRVRAVNSMWAGPWSPDHFFAVGAPPPAPGSPSVEHAAPRELTLTWEASARPASSSSSGRASLPKREPDLFELRVDGGEVAYRGPERRAVLRDLEPGTRYKIDVCALFQISERVEMRGSYSRPLAACTPEREEEEQDEVEQGRSEAAAEPRPSAVAAAAAAATVEEIFDAVEALAGVQEAEEAGEAAVQPTAEEMSEAPAAADREEEEEKEEEADEAAAAPRPTLAAAEAAAEAVEALASAVEDAFLGEAGPADPKDGEGEGEEEAAGPVDPACFEEEGAVAGAAAAGEEEEEGAAAWEGASEEGSEVSVLSAPAGPEERDAELEAQIRAEEAEARREEDEEAARGSQEWLAMMEDDGRAPASRAPRPSEALEEVEPAWPSPRSSPGAGHPPEAAATPRQAPRTPRPDAEPSPAPSAALRTPSHRAAPCTRAWRRPTQERSPVPAMAAPAVAPLESSSARAPSALRPLSAGEAQWGVQPAERGRPADVISAADAFLQRCAARFGKRFLPAPSADPENAGAGSPARSPAAKRAKPCLGAAAPVAVFE
eukprot:tig00020553_g10624.t1